MARCPKLETKSGGTFSGTLYCCELTGIEMYDDDPKVKHLCNPEQRSDYEYEKCPVYKDR